MTEENKESNIIAIIAILMSLMTILGMLMGCAEEISKPTAVRKDSQGERSYDPNAPEFSFLDPPEPNWVAFGDNERILHLYNTSKTRAMVERDEQIIAVMARKLIALESLHAEELAALAVDPNGPNGVKQ